MNRQEGNDKREPSPEWLAAYADGELDRDPALASFKKELEEWLAEHPDARAPLDSNRRLEELWQETTPVEPDPNAWAGIYARLQTTPPAANGSRLPRRWIAGILGLTAAAVWLVATVFGPGFPRPDHRLPDGPPGPELTPFVVASSDEIEILSVEGEDTNTLVVGDVPGRGPLELLGPGEVQITSVAPAARDNMRPEVRDGAATPMIWALLESER